MFYVVTILFLLLASPVKRETLVFGNCLSLHCNKQVYSPVFHWYVSVFSSYFGRLILVSF